MRRIQEAGEILRVDCEEGATRKEPGGQEPQEGAWIGYLELDVPRPRLGIVFKECALEVSEKPLKPLSSQQVCLGESM